MGGGKGGGGSGGGGTTVSQVTIPPEVLARYNAVNARAEDVAKTPFQKYSTDPTAFVAPMSDTQNAGVAGTNTYASTAQPYYNLGGGMTLGSAGAIDPTDLDAGAIDKYMSPYVKSVLDATTAIQGVQNAQQLSGLNGGAVQAGAFGGDRAGVGAANLAYMQNLANTKANADILQAGYTQALDTAKGQQSLDLGARQADAARMMAAGKQYADLGAGAQTAGLQGAAAQLSAGQVEQQTEQAGKSALYNQFLQEQGYPFQVAQFLANIAMGTGALSGSTTTTTQPTSFWSDERLKEDIQPIGETFDGQKIIKFRYKGEKEMRVGLLAQDVEKKHPEAVSEYGGYKAVDYEAATEDAANRGHFARGGYAEGGTPTADDPRIAAIVQALAAAREASPYGSTGLYGSTKTDQGPYRTSLSRSRAGSLGTAPRAEMKPYGFVYEPDIDGTRGMIAGPGRKKRAAGGVVPEGYARGGFPLMDDDYLAANAAMYASAPWAGGASKSLDIPTSMQKAPDMLKPTMPPDRSGPSKAQQIGGGLGDAVKMYGPAKSIYGDIFSSSTPASTPAQKQAGLNALFDPDIGGASGGDSIFGGFSDMFPFKNGGVAGPRAHKAGGGYAEEEDYDGRNPLGGAMKGAGMGSMFGPWGALAGGVLGLVTNLSRGGVPREERYKGGVVRNGYADGGSPYGAFPGGEGADRLGTTIDERLVAPVMDWMKRAYEGSPRAARERQAAGVAGPAPAPVPSSTAPVAQIIPPNRLAGARPTGGRPPARSVSDAQFTEVPSPAMRPADGLRGADMTNALAADEAAVGDRMNAEGARGLGAARFDAPTVEDKEVIVPAGGVAIPEGGLAPYGQPENNTPSASGVKPERDFWDRSLDFLGSEKFLVPLAQGLSTMASSPSRYLSASILQGLGGAAQGYEQVANAQPERVKAIEEAKKQGAEAEWLGASAQGKYADIVAQSIQTDPITGRTMVRVYDKNNMPTMVPFAMWRQNPSAYRLAPNTAYGLPQRNPDGSPVTEAQNNAPAAAVSAPAAPPVADMELAPNYRTIAEQNYNDVQNSGFLNMQKFPGNDPFSQVAKNATDARMSTPQTLTMAKALADTDPAASGPIQAQYITPLINKANSLLVPLGFEPVDPSRGAAAEVINKIRTNIAAARQNQANQSAFAALDQFTQAIPSNFNSKEGQAQLVSSLLTDNQLAKDEDAFYNQYRAQIERKYGSTSAESQQMGRGLQQAFYQEHLPQMRREKDILHHMFTTPFMTRSTDPATGQVVTKPMAMGVDDQGKPITPTIMSYLVQTGGKVPPNVMKALSATYGEKEAKDMLRYFTGQ